MSNIYDTEDPDSIRYQFKIVLLGDGGTGKTCVVNRYCFNEFSETKLTLGLSFNSYSVRAEEKDNKFRIGLSIWDFGGQERFRPLLPQFISGCNGALYVFDLFAFHSLENLEKDWFPLLSQNSGDVPSLLIATKADLLDSNLPPIDKSSIEDYQQILGAKKIFRTSSKSGLNIKIVFKEIVRQILSRPPYNKRKIIVP